MTSTPLLDEDLDRILRLDAQHGKPPSQGQTSALIKEVREARSAIERARDVCMSYDGAFVHNQETAALYDLAADVLRALDGAR